VNQLYGGWWWMGCNKSLKALLSFQSSSRPRDDQKYQESRKLKMVFVDKARSLKKSINQR